ncbi:MAG TPA: ATP-dependent metallopeptidase FtsH/Yme1/Tma family protein, partial [Polyangiaceae bacterium]
MWRVWHDKCLEQRAMGSPIAPEPPPQAPRVPGRAGVEPPVGGQPRASWRGWLVLGLLLLSFWSWSHYAGLGDARAVISYSDFYKALDEEHVQSVTLKGQSVSGQFKGSLKIGDRSLHAFTTLLPTQNDPDFVPSLRKKGVYVDVKSEEQPVILQLLI